MINITKNKVKSIKKIRKTDNEYVYDIGMKNELYPWFFGNNILLHNSIYFSAYETIKEMDPTYQWTKENVIDLYDKIAELTNQSFTQFMVSTFGCSAENGGIIRAARELCAFKGLFIKKKRYAVLIFDKEGKRKDQDGKPGEIKAMGLDLKRADTPKPVQDFLNEVLIKVLTDNTKEDIVKYISDFRKDFRRWQPWMKGSPKRVNNLFKYTNIHNSAKDKKVMIPGHVLASINWNKLKQIYNDTYSVTILDGAKVVVCKLKPNPSGLLVVAYPVDQLILPDWFKELPFDNDAMEQAVIDQKLKNMIGVLRWELSGSLVDTFNDMFTF